MAFDVAKQAEKMQRIFFALSQAVDAFRLRRFDDIPEGQQKQLKQQAQALETRAQQYTADALAAIAGGIEPHLKNIQKATQDAQEALARLNDIAKAAAIVDASVALVGSIASGDIAAVGGNVENLVQAIG
jgi:hypothetical protein